jgi:hypothetical protein
MSRGRRALALALLAAAGCRGGRSYLRVHVVSEQALAVDALSVTVTNANQTASPVTVPVAGADAAAARLDLSFSLEFDASRSGPARVDVTALLAGGGMLAAWGEGTIEPGAVGDVLVDFGGGADGGGPDQGHDGPVRDGAFRDASLPDLLVTPDLASCSDGMRDGAETDVDCGGPDCAPCVLGLSCSVDRDCTSQHCLNSHCGGWAPTGPWGGSILSLAADPGNPHVAYAGTLGALWKTTDDGASWSSLDAPPALAALDVQEDVEAIAVDPTNALSVWVGTRLRLLHSTDGGASWSALSLAGAPAPPMGWGPFAALAFAPTMPRPTLLIGTGWGMLTTPDDGATFHHAGMESITALGAGGMDGRTVYAGGGGFGVIASDVDGVTWKQTPNQPTDVSVEQVGGIAVTRDAPPIVHVAGANGFYSFDGNNWTHPLGLPTGGLQDVTLDPSTSGVVWLAAGWGGIYRRSTNGNWAQLSQGLESAPVTFRLAPTPAQGGALWCGTSTGVYRTVNGANSWADARSNMSAFQVSQVVIDPVMPMRVFAAVVPDSPANMQLYRSSDGGATWTWLMNAPGAWTALAAATNNLGKTVLIAGGDDGMEAAVSISTDGGDTWTPYQGISAAAAATQVGAIAVDPANPMQIWLGTITGNGPFTGAGVFRSGDGGSSWTAQSTGLLVNGGHYKDANALAFDARGNLYLATEDVAELPAGGTVWSVIGTMGMLDPSASALAVDDPDGYLYVATQAGLYRTLLSAPGNLWLALERVGNYGSVSAVLVDTTHSGTMWAGSGEGIFKTTTGGTMLRDWKLQKAVFPVTEIAMQPGSPMTLFLGTLGGGVQKTINGGD